MPARPSLLCWTRSWREVRVDQLLPSLVTGDAISAHAAGLQQALVDLGHRSDIYVSEAGSAPLPGVATRRAEEMDGGTDVVLYHLSAGSEVTDCFLGSTARKVVVYHNITPPYFFEGWDPPMAELMRQGYRDLRRCAPLAQLGIGDSAYNCRALRAAGFARTAVLPVLVGDRYAPGEPAPAGTFGAELAERRRGGPLWLFVGRFVPSKCQADVVRAFAAYRRAVQSRAALVLIGAPVTASYRDAVLDLAGRLGVADAVVVRGPVSDADLEAAYRAADVLVCLSEHEGFCVPLVEAMQHGVPVVAYAAGAVPETAGDAAVLLSAKDPVVVAAAVDGVLSEPGLREELLRRGRRRASELSAEATRRRVPALLDEIL
ncbi:MAG: glycosyltransferase [Acidimicrobiales bacterium]